MIADMKARSLINRRVILKPTVYAELVIWETPAPVVGSYHRIKYRLALVANGVCVVRYDNEAGKGDHAHIDGTERSYRFDNVDGLIADFMAEARKWLDEHGDA